MRKKDYVHSLRFSIEKFEEMPSQVYKHCSIFLKFILYKLHFYYDTQIIANTYYF